MIQDVGNQALLWVIAVSGSVLLFGLILLISARFTKSEDNVVKESQKKTTPDIQPDASKKEIIPETMEEIEQQERIEKKKGKS